MPELETQTGKITENPYNSLTVINAGQLEASRKRNGNYVLPVGSIVLISGKLKEDPLKEDSIQRENLGMINLTLEVEVPSIGTGIILDEWLEGERFGFFEFNLDDLPENTRNIISDNRGLGRKKRSRVNFISDLELFYLLQRAGEPILQKHKPEEIGAIVFAAKLQGNLKLK